MEKPLFGTDTGYLQVVFPGPGEEDIDWIRVPEARLLVTPAIEAQLNARQKRIVLLLLQGEELTSRRCAEEFNVSRDTTAHDFNLLIELGVARKQGKGRSTR